MTGKILVFCCLLVTLITSKQVAGQEFLSDTMFLDELAILGIAEEEFLPGGLITSIEIDSLKANSATDYLLKNAAIPINQYGAKGQLASINLRGLGPSRTSVLWNDMPINSFTNGQSDLNLLSLSGPVKAQFMRGMGTSIYGSGAIAGTLTLDNRANFNVGKRLSLNQALGSFGYNQSGLGFELGDSRIYSRTEANYVQVDNDFPYEQNGETLKQRNAEYESINLNQDFAYLINSKLSASLNLWYNENDRQLQPARNDNTSDDRLTDKNLRSVFGFYWDENQWDVEAKAGYSRDHQEFNENNPLIVNRYFGLLQSRWTALEAIDVLLGVRSNHLIGASENFEADISELRTDLFTSAKWNPFNGFWIGTTIRQPLVDRDLKPLAPSFNARWSPKVKSSLIAFGLESQWSKGYRLPTLNDRYWDPGGNEDLQSELSRNLDVSVDGSFNFPKLTVSTRVGAFRNDVDNWIIWLPGGQEEREGQSVSFWFPSNIRNVLARGLEYNFQVEYHFLEGISISALYDAMHLRATNETPISEFDRSVDKQLPFTPRYSNLLKLSIDSPSWGIAVDRSYVGERFTEANNELDPLEDYGLFNMSFRYVWNWNAYKILLGGSLLNFTDVDYESYENRAMPGINFDFTVKLNYQF